MKTLILLTFLCIPLFCFAQQKTRRDVYRQEKLAWQKHRRQAASYPGFHLKKASDFMLAGLAGEIVGGALIASGTSSYHQAAYIAGGAFALAGFVCQIIGIAQIGKAGKLMINRKGLSFAF